MSSRRNGSVSRAAETASKTKLHMDRNPQHSRITDPSNPAGRRKELDNVMKRARQASPGSWDRKLLEVEEKDPNRWRHSGYKQLYLNGSRSPSPRRSRSPPPRRSRTPLPAGRRSRSRSSPRRRSRSPRREPRREPPRMSRRSPPRRSPRRSPRPRVRPAPRDKRPPSPPPKSSESGSSASSCSDESCSVCSAKNKKSGPPKGKPRSVSPRPGPGKRPPAPRAVQPTRELLKAREASKRTREEKVLEWQRGQIAAGAPPVAVKREGQRRVSATAVHAALASTRSESDSSPERAPPPRMTLSERFGKMAQWSQDRGTRPQDHMHMRITRRDAGLHVAIEPAPPELEGADGCYPEELLASAPEELLPSWDDVRVRYDYYKKRGYLRGLTLGDYVKWEEWWYKYQEWLKRERAYERWAEGEVSGSVRRERRRRGGRHRRS